MSSFKEVYGSWPYWYNPAHAVTYDKFLTSVGTAAGNTALGGLVSYQLKSQLYPTLKNTYKYFTDAKQKTKKRQIAYKTRYFRKKIKRKLKSKRKKPRNKRTKFWKGNYRFRNRPVQQYRRYPRMAK